MSVSLNPSEYVELNDFSEESEVPHEAPSTASSHDPRLLNDFQDRLRDGILPVTLHTHSGSPVDGFLELQRDRNTLLWRNSSRFSFHPQASSIALHAVQSLRSGRQTANFVRTIKFLGAHELVHSDDRCLSLCVPQTRVPGVSDLPTHRETLFTSFDLEFRDPCTRDTAFRFFYDLTHTQATSAAHHSNRSLPICTSTRCFQVIRHQGLFFLIVCLVIANIFCIALDPHFLVRTGFSLAFWSENVLLGVLTLEKMLQFGAYEGLSPHTWDRMETFVVAYSWFLVILGSKDRPDRVTDARLSFLSLRLLRCILHFRVWEGFNQVVDTLTAAIPMAMNALLCYGYYLSLFAILGMYMFNDALMYRCVLPASSASDSSSLMANPPRFCHFQSDGTSNCPSPMECVRSKPPNNGYTGFHSFQASFLTVFLISMRSGFGSAMDGALQATSAMSVFYFIAIVVFVSYMLLSLFVGVLRASYIAVVVHQPQRDRIYAQEYTAYLSKERPGFPELPSVTLHLKTVDRLRSSTRKWVARTSSKLLEIAVFLIDKCNFPISAHKVLFLLEPQGAWMQKIVFLVDSMYFEHCMNVLVVCNAILFALEYHGMSDSYAARLCHLETFCMALYFMEFMLVVASCRGIVSYIRNPWHRMDGLLLLSASIQRIVSRGSHPVVFVLGLFRLIRPFRMKRKNRQLLQVFDVFLTSLPPFVSLLMLHFIISSVFAVIGMQLFGGKFHSTTTSLRHAHFDSYGDSMLTLFKWTCGGNIWHIFFTALAATSMPQAFFFFLSYFVAVVCLLLNLMLVTFLRGFAMNDDEKRTTLSDQFQQRLLEMQHVHKFDEKDFLQAFEALYRHEIMYATLSGSLEAKKANFAKKWNARVRLKDSKVRPSGHPEAYTKPRALLHRFRTLFQGEWLTSDRSLFIFPPQSRFRIRCRRLEKESDKFVFAVIVIRTAMLTMQSPTYSNLIQEFTTLVEIFFASVLLFEFCIKVVSRGFLLTPGSYLSNPMNQLNAVVLLACSLLLLLPHSTMVTIFKLGRALGPIRVFYRVKTFRVITQALRQSTKQIICCVVLTFLLFYAFAVIGMQFFAGKFAFCNDANTPSASECHGFYIASGNNGSAVLIPRVWGAHVGLSFDHIGEALGAVLVVVTKTGWLPVLNLAIDIADDNTEAPAGQQIQHIASAYLAALFFVFLILFTRFYLVKVFAGVIMNNFRCHNGTLLLTNAQLTWWTHKQKLLSTQPKYPLFRNRVLQNAHVCVQSRRFRGVMSLTILLHTLLLAWDRSSGSRGLWYGHYVFSMMYALDAIMHVMSMGWKDFLLSGFTWRTTNSLAAFVMLFGPIFSTSPLILIVGMTRAFDFAYISLVFDKFQRLQLLFETLLASTRLVLKVTLLLGYVLFIFATFGMQLFALTKWSYGLEAYLNFLTFPSAFTAFVKFAAGEDWYDTHLACSVGLPRCSISFRAYSASQAVHTLLFDQFVASDCGSLLISWSFYYLFYVLVVLILQNLYVATVVDTYVSTFAVNQSSQRILGFRVEDAKHFQSVWSEFDKQALGYIHRRHLPTVVNRLMWPLGLARREVTSSMEASDSLLRPGSEQMESSLEHELSLKERRTIVEDVQGRMAEIVMRGRVNQERIGAEFECPSSMIRFTDLLLVVTERIVPLECLSVREKVDELAIRQYVARYRQAIRIQAVFRMYRVRSRRSNVRFGARFGRKRTKAFSRDFEAVRLVNASEGVVYDTKLDKDVESTEKRRLSGP
uniref:Voltagegated Ion Channel (VIC) Superfamily putative n=1 Tax=Albugo laibachii Nc14 TaxID=890382 RepID=F0WKT7_9STRA|nr:Voltagegated Ion Channel (VIC) Superfamily putative [Albugo laibachii Nc14]|eukprot:CCA21894.1 Voltagegated Ion Channel (VIC) Superfamily putative [Albugo laibachii Nc14]